MKKSQLAICLLFIAFIIPGLTVSAQKTDSKTAAVVNLKEIVGKWNYLQTTPSINIAKTYAKPAASVADTSKVKTAPQAGIRLDKNKFREMHKASLNFNNANLEFLVDKTCIKTRADSVKYSWKTSGKNVLNIRNLKTKEKIKFEVRKLNSDTLQIAQTFESGSLTFSYLRVK
jgi:hypothetical protein